MLSIGLGCNAMADEGMWLPLHIERLKQVDMEKMGLQLTSSEIYSINHSSIKDAIVSLGGGFCTGEIISKEGLMLTNHHCGYDYIQQHSTIDNNLLDNGFWAQTKEDELPNEGLFVQFLIRMEDVSKKVLNGVKDKMTELERNSLIEQNISDLQFKVREGTQYEVKIKSFFEGNEYYLFVYETFNDIRLVGTPPESIGNFGGSTDNWMWPRQTGDFSLFRIYTSPDGQPAEYAPENIPLNPRYHLPISLDGVQEKDFAFVMGYPGSTNRYMTSYGVKMAVEETNPGRVKIRGKRLEIMKESMDTTPSIKLSYASKYAGLSNYWKYFIGQTIGLKKLDVYYKKVAIEKKLTEWIQSKNSRISKYGDPIAEISEAYLEIEKNNLPYYYILEAGFGTEFINSGYKFYGLINALNDSSKNEDDKNQIISDYRNSSINFFKDYNIDIDKKIFLAMIKMTMDDIDDEFVPEAFKAVNLVDDGQSLCKDFIASKNNDYESFANYIFTNSILVNESKMMTFYENPDANILEKDPGYILANSVYNAYSKISPNRGNALEMLESGRRRFIVALRKMNSDKDYYADANSTMRLTYGEVLGYSPKDAVNFHYSTTLKGVIEKEDSNNSDFIVPPKLKDLYYKKNFGDYGTNGILYVGFTTNNDITGGNSGSPVINATGQLIGTAFDGNWEAMSGDIAFEPGLQRCINVDIRYVLFIIDKFAGASHLTDEMTLIKNGTVINSN